MDEKPKRLYRSRADRMIAGVLGGIAEYANVDPSIVRIAFVVVTIFTAVFPAVFLYLVMAIIVPEAPRSGPEKTAEGPESP